MLHVVMFSTGLSSAVVLDKVQKMHGRENTIALLTDTNWEDKDNYRFGFEVLNYLKTTLVYQREGRTPEEVWLQTRYLVGPTGSPCTRILKIEQTIKFIQSVKQPITLYFGINADEEHRTYSLINRYEQYGVKCEFPLIDEPLHHLQMTDLVQKEWGIKRPRMYDLGFSHANCGGRCVKAGQKHFIHLMKVWPERFKQMADIEQRFRETTSGDTTILRASRGGCEVKLPLHQLKQEYEANLNGQVELCWESETPCECMF